MLGDEEDEATARSSLVRESGRGVAACTQPMTVMQLSATK